MLQPIRLGKWLVEVDPLKTQKFYRKYEDVCNCLYCKNFIESSKFFNVAVLDIFNKLGILPGKPSHLSEYSINEVGIRLYIGDYHFVGRVLEGELCTATNFTDLNTFKIENFTFGFTEDLEFVPEGFPTPVLQLIVVANIPWILNEHPEN